MRLIGLAVVLALSLTLAPLAAQAQQSVKGYRIGLLMGSSESFVAPYIEISGKRCAPWGMSRARTSPSSTATRRGTTSGCRSRGRPSQAQGGHHRRRRHTAEPRGEASDHDDTHRYDGHW